MRIRLLFGRSSSCGSGCRRPFRMARISRRERASTTGRFGAKTSGEIDLYEADKRSRLIKYPEIEEARLEEVEKAKFKIDELHKNYYALQSSQKAAEAARFRSDTKRRISVLGLERAWRAPDRLPRPARMAEWGRRRQQLATKCSKRTRPP